MRSKVREAYLLNFKFANTQNLLAFLDSIYPTLLNLILFFFLEPKEGQSPAHSPRSPPPQGRQSPEAAHSPQGRQSTEKPQSPANEGPGRGPQQAQVAQFPLGSLDLARIVSGCLGKLLICRGLEIIQSSLQKPKVIQKTSKGKDLKGERIVVRIDSFISH